MRNLSYDEKIVSHTVYRDDIPVEVECRVTLWADGEHEIDDIYCSDIEDIELTRREQHDIFSKAIHG